MSKKLSKQGKAFAFVRFKKVNDVDSLIRSLRSIWMGSFRLFSNVARFNWDTVHKPSVTKVRPNVPMHVPNRNMNSYAAVAKGNDTPDRDIKPVMILEKRLLNYEGFPSVKMTYLGGFWVLMEFDSIQSCEKFQTHNRIKSWFSSIEKWSAQFEVKDRVVWVDVEGVPLKSWSFTTFHKIAKKWGDLVILEGKVVVVRAKEVTRWVPEFRMEDNSQQQDDTKDESDKNSCDVESSHAKDDGKEVKENQENDKIESKPDKSGKRGEAEKSLKQLQ
nr:hypothetical protein [Tanacetum cinerariifolium]